MMFLRCASLPVSRLLPSFNMIIGTPLKPAKPVVLPDFFSYYQFEVLYKSFA
jgi:hypothetical protein